MRNVLNLYVLLSAAVGCAACSSDSSDGDSSDGGSAVTCTPAGTQALVEAADVSQLLSVVDEASQSVLLEAVIDGCCPICQGAATDRPLRAAAQACVSCSASYAGGNPAEHITGCTASVCGE